MPKVIRAASETIRKLLKPPVQHSLSEDRLRNDRQSYFAMTRALVDAQLKWRDAELSSRLWDEVADRDMDRGRILHLLYSVESHHDEDALQRADIAYLQLIDPKDLGRETASKLKHGSQQHGGMGRLPCRAAFKLNGHDAVGQESNSRKNGQTDAQGTVREAQDGNLPDVMDPSQARSWDVQPSLQQASRKTRSVQRAGLDGWGESGW